MPDSFGSPHAPQAARVEPVPRTADSSAVRRTTDSTRTPRAADPSRPQVPAADQTLRILSFLARQRGPAPASAIAATLGIPRSTVYHLLATLQEHHFVVHL